MAHSTKMRTLPICQVLATFWVNCVRGEGKVGGMFNVTSASARTTSFPSSLLCNARTASVTAHVVSAEAPSTTLLSSPDISFPHAMITLSLLKLRKEREARKRPPTRRIVHILLVQFQVFCQPAISRHAHVTSCEKGPCSPRAVQLQYSTARTWRKHVISQACTRLCLACGPIQMYGTCTFPMAEIAGLALTDLSLTPLGFEASSLATTILITSSSCNGLTFLVSSGVKAEYCLEKGFFGHFSSSVPALENRSQI